MNTKQMRMATAQKLNGNNGNKIKFPIPLSGGLNKNISDNIYTCTANAMIEQLYFSTCTYV